MVTIVYNALNYLSYMKNNPQPINNCYRQWQVGTTCSSPIITIFPKKKYTLFSPLPPHFLFIDLDFSFSSQIYD